MKYKRIIIFFLLIACYGFADDTNESIGTFMSENTFDTNFPDCDDYCNRNDLQGQVKYQCEAYNKYRGQTDVIKMDNYMMILDSIVAGVCWGACAYPAAANYCDALGLAEMTTELMMTLLQTQNDTPKTSNAIQESLQ